MYLYKPNEEYIFDNNICSFTQMLLLVLNQLMSDQQFRVITTLKTSQCTQETKYLSFAIINIKIKKSDVSFNEKPKTDAISYFDSQNTLKQEDFWRENIKFNPVFPTFSDGLAKKLPTYAMYDSTILPFVWCLLSLSISMLTGSISILKVGISMLTVTIIILTISISMLTVSIQ